jgi:hypothetical protein
VKCPTCNTPLKPLLTSWYCPLECDIKAARWTNLGLPEPDALFEFQDREPTQPTGTGFINRLRRGLAAPQPTPAPSAGYFGWMAGMPAWLVYNAGVIPGTRLYGVAVDELVPVGELPPVPDPGDQLYRVRFDVLISTSSAAVTVLQ